MLESASLEGICDSWQLLSPHPGDSNTGICPLPILLDQYWKWLRTLEKRWSLDVAFSTSLFLPGNEKSLSWCLYTYMLQGFRREGFGCSLQVVFCTNAFLGVRQRTLASTPTHRCEMASYILISRWQGRFQLSEVLFLRDPFRADYIGWHHDLENLVPSVSMRFLEHCSKQSVFTAGWMWPSWCLHRFVVEGFSLETLLVLWKGHFPQTCF